MPDLNAYRAEFPVTERRTYMNHAAVSPLSKRILRASEECYRDFSLRGAEAFRDWMDRIEQVRELMAGLLNAESFEIAFTGNTSDGLSAVANGIDWNSGDAVLITDPDFPANIYPWMNLDRRGVAVRRIARRHGRFDVRDMEKALSGNVRLVSVSSVDFATGFRCDLQAVGDFCRRKGLLLCVDAIQSLGAIPTDVRQCGIHFLAAGGHKWLLGPMGCGVLYVASEANAEIRPERVGWKSVVGDEDFFRIRFDLKPDAARFETGTMNAAGIHCLGAAVELLQEVGVENSFARIQELTDLLAGGLTERKLAIVSSMEPGERSGILSFLPAGNANEVFLSLARRGVAASLRGDTIRLSPHFYNNEHDAERFFQALDTPTGAPGKGKRFGES